MHFEHSEHSEPSEHFEQSEHCFTIVTSVLLVFHQCFKNVLQVFQRYIKNVYKNVSKVFQKCFKVVCLH